jgi:hypothetical protein
MEIDNNDGPKSPDTSTSEPPSKLLKQQKSIQQLTSTNIDYDDTKLDEKCKNLLKILEKSYLNSKSDDTQDEDGDDDENIQTALLLQNFHENNLYVQIKLFEFYVNKNLDDLSTNSLNKLIKFYSFIETDIFDLHLYLIAKSIIWKNLNIKIDDKIDEAQLEFYFKLFKNQSIRTQEKYLIQILDKLKVKFTSILKSNDSTNDKSLCDVYIEILKNENELLIFKYLLKLNSKYIQIYAIQLIDSLLNLEKQLLFSHHHHRHSNQRNRDDASNNDDLANKRSINLFRKICIIDFIYDYIALIDKLDNKIYYRWIEKSLEFFCKLILYSFDYVKMASTGGGDDEETFIVKQNQIDLLQVSLMVKSS